MGAKQTKCEGVYLPETPMVLKHIKYSHRTQQPLTVSTELSETVNPQDLFNTVDPRSPNGNRTPILLSGSVPTTKVKPTLTAMLRKRLIRGLLDPRSPSLEVTRTPIQVDERTFNLDDTFADLLVETRAPTTTTVLNSSFSNEEPNNEKVQTDINEMVDIGTEHSNSLSFVSMASEEAPNQEHTPITSSLIDPRSPTEGIERTPLIFTDDDDDDENNEKLENQMLEDVLAKLSLDLSSAAEHSLLSLGAISNTPDSVGDPENQIKAPTNKHLERVRVPKKPARLRRSGVNNLIITTTTPPSSTDIYEDCENISPISYNKTSFMNEGKRTPLSCVGNHGKLRKMQTKIPFGIPHAKFDKIKDINSVNMDEDKIEA